MPRTFPRPVVGMGATYYIGGDRYAMTIVAVSKSARVLTVQRDRGDLIDGQWTLRPNPNAELEVWSLRQDGYYHLKGRDMRGGYLIPGVRDPYSDPSF